PVGGHVGDAEPWVAASCKLCGNSPRGIGGHAPPSGRQGLRTPGPVHPAQPARRRDPPLLLAPGGNAEVSGIVGLPLVQPGYGGGGLHRPLQDRHQPTAPSICSSISRFSSRAYSIGSSRAIRSPTPRTILAIASSSVIPRLIR